MTEQPDTSSPNSPGQDTIHRILQSIYGTSMLTEALAESISERWNTWANEPDPDPFYDLEQHLTLHIWLFFPGGSTAAVAAERILTAARTVDTVDTTDDAL